MIDGATPKTTFRYPDGATPGLMATRLVTRAIQSMPAALTAYEAVRHITSCLHQDSVRPADRPIASVVIYSQSRHEVWMVGDCQFMTRTVTAGGDDVTAAFDNRKRIDLLLSEWRRDVITSLISRGVMTADDIRHDDVGRRIIQHFITQQVRYQNMSAHHRLAYGMLDGEPIPEQYIRIYPLAPQVTELVLATDGYPVLCPTLAESESRLHAMLNADPLCIGCLLGTKGVSEGNTSFDDRTYLRIKR